MARAMEHQAALLLGRLGRDEPHVGPGDRLADGLGVSRIVFLPFDVGLYVGRRHQAHGVAERLELARPIIRRGTGLDANQACWNLLKERQNVTALQLPWMITLPCASTPWTWNTDLAIRDIAVWRFCSVVNADEVLGTHRYRD